MTIHGVLEDGTAVTFRPIRPEDKARLRAAFERLSPESRYRRFFAAKDHLSESELRYLTEVDYVTHFAWVALLKDDPDEPGIGVGRWVLSADEPEVAEAAVTVIDDYQNRGLGKALLALLVQSASEQGIRAFRASVLGDNVQMLGLLRDLGATPHGWQSGVGTFKVELPKNVDNLPDTPMARVLKAAATGEIALAPKILPSPSRGR
jgi:GNAT superfamily N-acetyltransferase